MALFKYLKLFEYYQKLLIFDPSHCIIQFSIVQDKIMPHFQLIFACITCVRFVTHNEFDFIRLKQVAQARKLADFKVVGHFEAKV